VLALGLLLFLRLNMGFDTGLPIQEMAVNMRYDLAPVPFMLLGVLLLLGKPSLWRVALVGVLFGIATLMQFYGAPSSCRFPGEDQPRGINSSRTPGRCRGRWSALLGSYILDDLDSFKGQAGTIDRRADFDRPLFYVDNIAHEPDRFLRPLAIKEVPLGADHEKVSPRFLSLDETLRRRPSAKLAVLVGLPLALAFVGRRALQQRERGDRLLLLCLGGLVLQYTLFESAKFYIYWLPVVPFLCIGFASALWWLLQKWDTGRAGLALAAASVLILLVIFGEGSVARLSGLRTAPEATNYARLADRIHEYVPSGSRVVGSTSLWWGMRDTEYRSYFLFFYLTRPDAGDHRPLSHRLRPGLPGADPPGHR
jgi:hypothetical protein